MSDNEEWIKSKFRPVTPGNDPSYVAGVLGLEAAKSSKDPAGCMWASFLAAVICAVAIFGGFSGARAVRAEKGYAGVGVMATTQTPAPTVAPTPVPTSEEEVVVVGETPSATQAPDVYGTPVPTNDSDCVTTQTGSGVSVVCGNGGGMSTGGGSTPHPTTGGGPTPHPDETSTPTQSPSQGDWQPL